MANKLQTHTKLENVKVNIKKQIKRELCIFQYAYIKASRPYQKAIKSHLNYLC